MCLTPRTRVFTSKPNSFRKSQEEYKFLCQKIKELEDKVDDLKSAAKRRKIFFVTVNKETKEVLAPRRSMDLTFVRKFHLFRFS
jgi:hypothetical protein